jgi:uncharacterized C2H2 Zn-finger protein
MSLSLHVTLVHEKKSLEAKCTECDMVFPRRVTMQRHRNKIHFPEK